MGSNLAMVALRSKGSVDWTAIAHAWGVDRPEVAASPKGTGPTAVTLPIPGGSVGLAHMPMPIPWGDLDWPVRTAWHWPTAETELRNHFAHVVVFVSSDRLSVIELNLQLVRAVASVVAACPDAVGVYCGHASVVIQAGRYLEEAQEASTTNLPIALWLGLHLVRGEAGLTAYTTGMEAFDLLNLEAQDTDMTPPHLLGLLASVAHYEIDAGIQIDDGETAGGSPGERIEIRHRPSRFREGAVSCHLLVPRTAV
jgi:hypothetical protein